MSSRTTGENVAVYAVVIVLILGGATILSVPFGVRSSLDGSSASSGETPNTGRDGTPNAVPGTLSSFLTYAQLRDFIASNAKSMQGSGPQGWPGVVTTTIAVGAMVGGMMTTTATTSEAMGQVSTTTVTNAATSTTGAAPSFTTTNNQVRGVDELDIVKTDGTYLYVASSQTVSIIKAYPVNESALVSAINLPDYSVTGMALGSQRLAILARSLVNSSVDLRLYNVSSPSSPSLVNSVAVDGSFVGARTTQGYFYMVVQQPSYSTDGSGNLTAAYPTIVEDGVSSVIPPGSTYYTPNRSQVNVYTMVLSMSMSTGAESSVAVLTGPSSTVYVSTSNIYVVYSNFYPRYADGIAGDVFNGGNAPSGSGGEGENSTVFRVSYSGGNVTVAAAGSFPGGVLNQYSMSEYESYFMVATSRSGVDDVYVLNQTLGQVGAIRNIAPGENIYSVRFEGDLGYVVTFEQIDPLFTISLANPAEPVILSALEVTGFSDYLHPFGTDYLIGVGKDTVASSSGNFAYYLGLKLSLFNVTTGVNSSVVESYLIGSRGTSSAVLDNALAFTFDASSNTMVIPVNLYTLAGGQPSSSCSGCAPPYGEFTWQGVYVFNVSKTGFTLLGTVTQNSPGESPSTHEIDRSVIIGDVVYTISQNEVMASSLSDFSTLATINLG